MIEKAKYLLELDALDWCYTVDGCNLLDTWLTTDTIVSLKISTHYDVYRLVASVESLLQEKRYANEYVIEKESTFLKIDDLDCKQPDRTLIFKITRIIGISKYKGKKIFSSEEREKYRNEAQKIVNNAYSEVYRVVLSLDGNDKELIVELEAMLCKLDEIMYVT